MSIYISLQTPCKMHLWIYNTALYALTGMPDRFLLSVNIEQYILEAWWPSNNFQDIQYLYKNSTSHYLSLHFGLFWQAYHMFMIGLVKCQVPLPKNDTTEASASTRQCSRFVRSSKDNRRQWLGPLFSKLLFFDKAACATRAIVTLHSVYCPGEAARAATALSRHKSHVWCTYKNTCHFVHSH